MDVGEPAGKTATPVYAPGLFGVFPAYRAGTRGTALIHRYQLNAVTFELICQQVTQTAESPLANALVVASAAVPLLVPSAYYLPIM
ncbi:hypothetical protein [Thermincola ferriacetica]|uniref:hypothetical protein n=1 Tax=Thermincola ferriacetica TaxID=281456 RepID=UPI001FA6E5C5|nr:hypothetical protein [Thermincola ferriacetica]